MTDEDMAAIRRMEDWADNGDGKRGCCYNRWGDSLLDLTAPERYHADVYDEYGCGEGVGDTIEEAVAIAFEEHGKCK